MRGIANDAAENDGVVEITSWINDLTFDVSFQMNPLTIGLWSAFARSGF
jgi:hypothetical protein